MKCPKCRHEQPDGLTMCSGCTLEFSRWSTQAPSASAAALPPGTAMVGGILNAAMVAVVAGSVAGSVQGIRNAPRIPEDVPVERPVEAPKEPARAGPPPVPKDGWRFEGRVLDLYRVKPVAGATVMFSNTVFGAGAFESRTDGQGRYLVDARMKPGGGYYVLIQHPEYRPNTYVDATKRDLGSETFEQLVSAGRRKMMLGPNYSGVAGQSVTYHFALVPATLTKDEQAKVDAVPPE